MTTIAWIVFYLVASLVVSILVGFFASIEDNKRFEELERFKRERDLMKQSRLPRLRSKDLPSILRRQGF